MPDSENHQYWQWLQHIQQWPFSIAALQETQQAVQEPMHTVFQVAATLPFDSEPALFQRDFQHITTDAS